MTKKTALHIISSARGSESFSKGLSSAIVDKLIGNQEIDVVVERDLTKETPPFLHSNLVGAFYKDPRFVEEEERQLLKYADSVVSDVSKADILILGTPMYNLGMSALLKAWIDQLVRYGITYSYNEKGAREGHLNGKKVYLAIASGGRLQDWSGNYEFIASHVKAVFDAYIGLTDVEIFRVEGTAMPGFQPDYQKILENL
ncbi:FMN-dependent NADH-azoreductase [Chitinophaga arvensicola]|uniref:FMN dependent NADH:quinone oxidoreductase n=1 Tax=Chitinophaga arvensicola TaxID=29529 RepID=A0A1I0S9D7_9BACT|nr:NAD(P)H-dependent oxidoreductase [Chitinophaga arvensicola]SEW52774.1 FMN-dependent NADH-azoreductase [Chitinophaga arvensicola]